MVLNVVALWKQEARDPARTAPDRVAAELSRGLARLQREAGTRRAGSSRSALGTVAFSMQDILLEPYGGQVLHLTVGTDDDADRAARGRRLCRLRARRALARPRRRSVPPGRVRRAGRACSPSAAVIFAAPLRLAGRCSRIGTALIGFGGGLFAPLHADRRDGARRRRGQIGLALGVWGAVQASAAGCAIAARRPDPRRRRRPRRRAACSATALTRPATGYRVVYHIEIAAAVRDTRRPRPAGHAARDRRVGVVSKSTPSAGFGLAGSPR